jgi:hypothetical protein
VNTVNRQIRCRTKISNIDNNEEWPMALMTNGVLFYSKLVVVWVLWRMQSVMEKIKTKKKPKRRRRTVL